MKRVELEKLKGLKIVSKIHQGRAGGRPGQDAPVLSRREQRALDQAQGLVPFTAKLNQELVSRIHALAKERNAGLTEVVTDLIKKGLES